MQIGELWYELSPTTGSASVCAPPSGTYNELEALIPGSVTDVDGTVYEVSEIQAGAFRSSGVSRISVPGSVSLIGKDAFADCVSLSELRFEPGEEPLTIDDTVFDETKDSSGFAEMHFYCARELKMAMGKYLLRKSNTVSCLIEGVSEVGYCYLSECATLVEACFGVGLKKLSKGAFKQCVSLRKLVFPEGLVEMVSGVFDWCDALEEVWLPSTLESLEPFYDAEGLRDIYSRRMEPPTLLGTSKYPYNDKASGVIHVLPEAVEAYSSWASDWFQVVGDLDKGVSGGERVLTLRVEGDGILRLEGSVDGDCIATTECPEVTVDLTGAEGSLRLVASPGPGMDIANVQVLDGDGRQVAVRPGVRGRSLVCDLEATGVVCAEAVFTREQSRSLHVLMPQGQGSRMTLSLPQGMPYRFVYVCGEDNRLHSALLGDDELPVSESEGGEILIEIPDYEGEKTLRLVEEAAGSVTALREIADPAPASEIRLLQEGDTVVLSGLGENDRVSVYTPDGELRHTGRAEAGRYRLPAHLRGLHLITTPTATLRTML